MIQRKKTLYVFDFKNCYDFYVNIIYGPVNQNILYEIMVQLLSLSDLYLKSLDTLENLD